MSLLAKPGLNVIRIYIQKELGYKIAWYNMIINVLHNTIQFEVPEKEGNIKRRYPYDDKHGISKIVKTMTQKQLTTGDIIDIIKIEYRKDGVIIGVYFTDSQGLKQSKNINI